ncbi:winged helix-turn-helix domain-containing protein [Paenarthrobacter sp. RAF54_2]|uniref:winged helix-turn-helix domain-containing protein n=1 Tax=Paenarthrobacter sp. RAF54_2 TaxID=3233061 RepID=UPI003F982DE0
MSTYILMNRTRSQILRFLIRSGPSSPCVLASGLQASQATVRHHLFILESAGYVQALADERYSAHASLVECQLIDLAAQYSVQMPPTTAPPLAQD